MEKAIKSLGQNFLKNKEIVNKMVDLLGIRANFNIIEIGPGPGVFTTAIVKKLDNTNTFYAIDLDERFVNNLKARYRDKSNIQIIHANFLDWSRNVGVAGPTLMLGAIPYYITSPIIHNIIKMVNKPESVVLMVQKEVAEKITETRVNPNYFSVFIKTFYDIKYIDTVSKFEFTPVPKVDSAIIQMALKQAPQGISDIYKYENFLHLGFQHQKKMLNKVFKPAILQKLGIPETDRPHNLDVATWIKLFDEFYKENK